MNDTRFKILVLRLLSRILLKIVFDRGDKYTIEATLEETRQYIEDLENEPA